MPTSPKPKPPHVLSRKATPPQLYLAKQPKQPSKPTLTDTYLVASTCRLKLGKEAGRAEHELRRLVGHANMLDSLMDELSKAEREQEARLNAIIRAAPKKPEQPRRVQWLDTLAEELDEESSDSDDDSDDGSGDEEAQSRELALQRWPTKRHLPASRSGGKSGSASAKDATANSLCDETSRMSLGQACSKIMKSNQVTLKLDPKTKRRGLTIAVH